MSRHPDAHIAELDAIAAEFEAAGILTVTTKPDGTVIYALTRGGKPSAGSWR